MEVHSDQGMEFSSRRSIERLTPEFVAENIERFVELANLIPEVTYTANELLAEAKSDGRVLTDKWKHSYVLCEGGKIVGFIMGYHRAAEGNDQYPIDSLYMSELAVDPTEQGKGYGKQLVAHYLGDALGSETKDFTLQTNAAERNESVRKLYESFGFVVDGLKQYGNRQDVIMRADAASIRARLDENH